MRAHGTRSRYVGGCRCGPCKRANAAYQVQRQGATIEDQAVPATAARDHLGVLQDLGVGTRTVAARTGLARTTIARIRSGKVTRAHPATIKAILGVSGFDRAPGAWVDATRFNEMATELAAAGVPKVEIAHELGRPGARALQAGRGSRVRRANAEALEDLHWREWQRRPRLRLLCQHEPPVATIEEVVR